MEPLDPYFNPWIGDNRTTSSPLVLPLLSPPRAVNQFPGNIIPQAIDTCFQNILNRNRNPSDTTITLDLNSYYLNYQAPEIATTNHTTALSPPREGDQPRVEDMEPAQLFSLWDKARANKKRNSRPGLSSSRKTDFKPAYPTGRNTNHIRIRTSNHYRQVYSMDQRRHLEIAFQENPYLRNAERKTQLATELHLTERQVKIWFQNRRAKHKKELNKFYDPYFSPKTEKAATK